MEFIQTVTRDGSAEASAKIQADTDAWLAKGGKIDKLDGWITKQINGVPPKMMEMYSVAGKKGAAIGNKLRAAQLREAK